jgi:hypothetical protein
MPLSSRLVKAIENATGEKMSQLQGTPIDERRAQVEKRTGKSMSFYSAFPTIGRGVVLRGEQILSHDQVLAQFKKATR